MWHIPPQTHTHTHTSAWWLCQVWHHVAVRVGSQSLFILLDSTRLKKFWTEKGIGDFQGLSLREFIFYNLTSFFTIDFWLNVYVMLESVIDWLGICTFMGNLRDDCVRCVTTWRLMFRHHVGRTCEVICTLLSKSLKLYVSKKSFLQYIQSLFFAATQPN